MEYLENSGQKKRKRRKGIGIAEILPLSDTHPHSHPCLNFGEDSFRLLRANSYIFGPAPPSQCVDVCGVLLQAWPHSPLPATAGGSALLPHCTEEATEPPRT